MLNESDDLDIFGVTFDSKMTFEKHLRSASIVNFQRLCILRKSWLVFHDRLFLGRCFRCLSCPLWCTVLHCDDRLPIHAP